MIRKCFQKFRLVFINSVMAFLLLAFPVFTLGNVSYFNITSYGAKGNGVALNTKAIQSAIDACAKSGGGTVYVPAGRYLSGTLYMKSNVTLFLDAGAVLVGSKNLKDYPVTVSKTRSYTDNYTDKSFIYAEDLENISIIGKGIIDGNGASFKLDPLDNNEELRSADGFAYYKYRPFLIRMINCKNILVRDITLMNSAMWVQHYLACEDVNIDGITVNSRVNDNNDGIDIDGCNRVRISNCDISSGDDAIVLKSTLDRICKNVNVTNCTLSSAQNAFKLGTESNGGFDNIVFSNSVIYDTRGDGISLLLVDGGILGNVSISNITMNKVGNAIVVRLGDRGRPFIKDMPKMKTGSLSNIIISNIQATEIGSIGSSVTGIPGHLVENISFNNIRITYKGGGKADLTNREIPEMSGDYPGGEMFGVLPAYGFFCRHGKNIRFNNIELNFNEPDARPAIICDDINGLELKSIKAGTTGSAPLLWLKNVSDAFIQSCIAPQNSETFLQVSGSASKHITIMGNDLCGAKNAVKADDSSVVYMDNNQLATQPEKAKFKYVSCDFQAIDDRKIRITDAAAVKAKRLEIVRAIWGEDKLPERSDVLVTNNYTSPLNPCSYISRVDKYEIPVHAQVAEDSKPVNDLAYLFVPVNRNNRLILFNPGHSCTLKASPNGEDEPRIEATITGLLAEGFDVLAVYMPHVKETNCSPGYFDHCSVINTDLGVDKQLPAYGLRLFLDPTIVSLNYLLKQNKYKNINMVGLSGGGWTTNLLAAIDTRISYSFSVAGSMPLYYRYGGSIGDVEQFLPQLYRDVAGYPDLYVLGAYGKDRKQVQILNRNDDCCFGQQQHDPARNYDNDVKTFENSVKESLNSLGAKDHYYLLIDETAPNHQISEDALRNVILKELKGK